VQKLACGNLSSDIILILQVDVLSLKIKLEKLIFLNIFRKSISIFIIKDSSGCSFS